MKQKLLQSIRSRKAGNPGFRIGTVSENIARMAAVLGSGEEGIERLAKYAKSEADAVMSAIRNGGKTLTWFDPDNATPNATWTTKDGKVVCKGTPLKKEEGDDANKGLTDGSIMDFEAVFTTGRRDRDGDVLEPRGAILDPKMPLLWQHMPFSPLGKLVSVTEQTDQKVAGRLMIANTALGHDAAILVEAGCLRISHGFSPIEYQPLKDDDGKDLGGWRISKYAMMEVSLVSIPSNVDAEITAFSRGKFTTPIFKSWGRFLSKNRKLIVRGGYDSAKKKPGAKATLDITVRLKSLQDNLRKGKGRKADDDEDDDTADGGEGETGDEDDEEDDESEGESKLKLLGDLMESVAGLTEDESLPKEARNRLSVVNGMLEDAQESMNTHCSAIGEAAKNYDLAAICGSVAEMIEGCVKSLRGVSEEVQRIAGIEGLPEGVSSTISDVADSADQIVKAVETLSGAASKAEDDDALDPNEPGDDDTQGKDDDQDEDEGDGDDFADDTDDDEDDSETDDDGKAEDDSEIDEKDEDDSEMEGKADDDDNDQPDSEVDLDDDKAEDDSEIDEKAEDDEEDDTKGRNLPEEMSPKVRKLFDRLLSGERLSEEEMNQIDDAVDARRFV